MPAATELRDLNIKNLALPEQGRIEYPDSLLPRLVLRVSASGVKSWSYHFDFKGERFRLSLGQFPGVGVAAARERAREARLAVQRGENPVEKKKEEERQLALDGFTDCVSDFIEKYAKVHQREWKETKRILEKEAVPVFKDRPVASIRRREVVDLLDAVYGLSSPALLHRQ